MIQLGGRTLGRLLEDEKGATYHRFDPPRRPEQYVGQPGPHNGLALPHSVIEAIGKSRVRGEAHGYLVRGEWVRRDGIRFLDIAVDVGWVVDNVPDMHLVGGFLRYVCPGCGRMSGNHTKGCSNR